MQAAGFTNPGFTLTITEYRHEVRPPSHAIIVRLTNTSNEIIRGGGCLGLRGMYNLSVNYNGMPMEETDPVRALKKYRKGGGGCTSGNPVWIIKPGEYNDDFLSVTEFYKMDAPGIYDISVSKETLPDYPDKSVTIKSNTLTIVVPGTASNTPQ